MEIYKRIQLVDLIKHFDLHLVGVEIGVAGGTFSEELLQAGMQMIYSIDSWQKLDVKGDGSYPQEWHDINYEQAKERLSKYEERSKVLKEPSLTAVNRFHDGSLSLIYHDADHSYESVLADIKAWYPKLTKGGVMSWHDYFNEGYGVSKAVEEFFNPFNIQIHFIQEDNINNASAWVQKP